MNNEANKARHKVIRKLHDELLKVVSVQLLDNSIEDVSVAVGRMLVGIFRLAGLAEMAISNQLNEIARMVRDRAYK